MMNEFNTDKKAIKRKARGLSFFLIGHQLFFNIGSTILLVILIAALELIGMKHLEDSMLCITSDVM